MRTPGFKHIFITVLLFSLSGVLLAQEMFNKYFLDRTMRIDYFHTGDATTEIVALDHVYQYGIWSGSLKNLIDQFDNGQYYHKVYDVESNTLIYSKGFNSYFYEYTTSSAAHDGIQRTYHESALLPYPRKPIRFVLEKRTATNQMQTVFSVEIDPESVDIIREEPGDPQVLVIQSHEGNHPHNSVDIAFIGEGYTRAEVEKFKSDLKRFTDYFFSKEPYRSNKDKFNLYGVLKPSIDSGVDEPRHNVYKRTALNATFNSLGSERYLLTEDNKTLRDIAAHVPYDALYIMVNHTRYGGGGIYNLYCTFTTDNQWSEYLFVHEFGHSLLGLADEYYTSSVAYNDFYPPGVEPWEPNITKETDPNKIKWRKYLTPGIELPTPWEKAAFDSMDLQWQQKRRELNDHIAYLKRTGAPASEVREAEALYNKLDREHSEKIHNYLKNSKYYRKVGAFEGAGYASKGIYRPMVDCIMFTKSAEKFCVVCEAAIQRIIDYYSN